MEHYVFDIILITLAIVVILHLFYNNSLFATQCKTVYKNENMENIGYEKSMYSDVHSDLESERSYNEVEYDDGEYRDPNTSGLDRTDPIRKPWYHVANKLVTGSNDDSSNNSSFDIESTKIITKESTIPWKNKKQERLVFENNYEQLLSSDPIEARRINELRNMQQMRKPEEKMIDAFGNQCNFNEDSVEMKRYIRDYALDGNRQCECVTDKTSAEFTRTDVNEYREKQIQFRDKIMGSSAPAEDPVDRVNNVLLNGGIKAKGQTIAEFYDNLVAPKYESQIREPKPDKKCVASGTLDLRTGIPHVYYKNEANNGKQYMLRDNWMYPGENPHNGGAVFDDIYGDDKDIDYNSMI